MTIKLINMYNNTIRVVETDKVTTIPPTHYDSYPGYLIDGNFYDGDEWYWEKIKLSKIKIRDDKDADWNLQNFPKGSGGPYDYDYKGEE